MKRCLLTLLLIMFLLSQTNPVRASDTIHIYFIGPDGALKKSLSLAQNFEITQDLNTADVIVINGPVLNGSQITERVRSGAGLLIVPGNGFQSADLNSLQLPGLQIQSASDTEISLVQAAGQSDPILDAIIWTSAPRIKERLTLSGVGLTPLVVGFEDQSVILARTALGMGSIYLCSPIITADQNVQFQQWAYFNYFIYHLVERLANQTPLSFGQYSSSPVPHEVDRWIILTIMAVILAIISCIFWFVRRYSLAHPEELNSLVIDRKEYETRQESTAWDEIGFHRPLGGFLLAFLIGVIAFIPLIVYQNMILPAFILPSAQALGIWGRVTQFFAFLWQLFDMGTAAAFVKFFAEYRIHDPKKAIQFGQLYIWWQLLSGAIQVAMVVTISSIILPESPYALYAWSVVLHSFIQIPGFLGVMRLALNSYQRADYGQIVTLATEVVLPIIIQPIFVTIMVVWGRSNPVFGESMGGLLGLGISAYMVQLAAFLLGFWLFRRLGYSTRVLFLAHFDGSVIRQAFRFGTFEMLGSVAWAIGQAMEIVVTQTRLVNYAEIWGNWGLAQNFVFSFSVISSLYDNMMPSISEAISNGKKILGQYYSVMAYKWGGMISAYICAVLLAVADRFILGASGPQFSRAAVYAIPLIFWGAIQYPSWVGDTVQLGSNRPYIKSTLIFGEQTIRIVLAFLLIERFQVTGLIAAYFIGLFAKDIVAYFINHRVCYPQAFYFWQSLGAPALAGAVHYLLLRWLTGYIWQGDQVTSVVIFFLGILPSYPIFAFLYGLFGGWDDDTLGELKQSVALSSFMKPLAWLFWRASAFGARFSPLHGRFPISIRNQALLEARGLMDERVRLP